MKLEIKMFSTVELSIEFSLGTKTYPLLEVKEAFI